jgi:membrane-associated protease RseP (regulator of RpoE activity)
LVIALAAVVLISAVSGNVDLLIVIAAIVVMIMVHELGHFVTAKASGMKVTEYFLGFGPRLWSVHRGETEYGIKAIPAGGYVKIIGMTSQEEVDPADEPRTYRQQPFHNRLAVALAGSFMHLVMAFVLLWIFLVSIGPMAVDTSVAKLAAVSPGGPAPARVAGMHAGDVIVSIDGRRMTTAEQLQRTISSHAGVPLHVFVRRGHPPRLVGLTVTPVRPAGATGSNSGRIGIELGSPGKTVAPWHALGTATIDVGREIKATALALATTFSPHGLSQFFSQLGNSRAAQQAAQNDTRPQSIYGAVRTGVQGAQASTADLIFVLVSLNISLAMLNLFPMLPLDGGHVVVAVYERIRTRKGRRYFADVTKLTPVAYAFVLFLAVFVVSAVYLDITHPLSNQFK